MQSNVVCPVSEVRVNESVVRTVASLIFLTCLLVMITGIKWLALLLIADFAIRAFSPGELSIFKYIAKSVAEFLKFPVKPIDAAPKKFAALVGFIFSVIISISLFLSWNLSAEVFGTVLVICAGLEAFAGFCVGCQFYTWIILPAKRIFKKA